MTTLRVLCCALLLCACGPAGPFPRSDFWQPLPDAPDIDADSDRYIADLMGTADRGRLHLNLTYYNVPVYAAGRALSAVRLSGGRGELQVPLPADALPSVGSDASLVVLDPGAHQSYELWQAKPGEGGWSATSGGVFDTREDGVRQDGTAVRSTGLSLLLGLLRHDEVAGGGPIRHALALAFDSPNSQYFVPPAISSDGKVKGGRKTSLPAGSRVQLDPAVDLDALGLSPAARRVGEALQRYGLLVVDTAAGSAIIAEELRGTGRSWEGLLEEDALRALPVSRLRVLRPSRRVPIP